MYIDITFRASGNVIYLLQKERSNRLQGIICTGLGRFPGEVKGDLPVGLGQYENRNGVFVGSL